MILRQIAIDRKTRRPYPVPQHEPEQLTIEKVGRQLWEELHTKLDATQEWFDAWLARIPQFGCDCAVQFSAILKEHPPQFGDAYFPWTNVVHNAVNDKLTSEGTLRPQVSLLAAIATWRPDLWPQQPPINSFFAITALSLLPKHHEVQNDVLNSWKNFGLEIVAQNTEAEIEQLKDRYPQVDEWIVSEKTSTIYDYPTQLIINLLRVATHREQSVLLINSDCALYGPQDLLEVGSPLMCSRWNYDEGKLHRGKRFVWGLDAVLLTPDQVATLPDLPFAIGQTMWDYWLPYHFEQRGEVRWLSNPLLYHSDHPVHWSQQSLEIGRQIMHQQYGTALDQQWWADWRMSRIDNVSLTRQNDASAG